MEPGEGTRDIISALVDLPMVKLKIGILPVDT